MNKLLRLALLAAACAGLPARAQDTASDTVRRAIHVCASCHGEGGRSDNAGNPSLAGQTAQYLQRQLKDFRSQARSETSQKAFMWGISALLDDATITGLAEYYAAQQPPRGIPGNTKLMAEGRRIFEQGLPLRGVRACADCHGDQAEGQAGFPRLAGQYADYLVNQLRVFRSTPCGRSGVLMKGELRGLTDAELRAVATYLQSL
jgi:cytochrome c553